MSLVLTGEFGNHDNSAVNKIEIHDRDGLYANIGEFCVRGRAEISRPQSTELFTPLLPTSMSFGMYIPVGNTALETWIADLEESEPGRYFIKYYIDNDLKYVMRILTEGIEVPESHKPYGITIQCTDALGLAQDYTYTQNAAWVDSTLPLLDHIWLALDILGVKDYYTDGERYLITSIKTYETNMNTSDDVLNQTAIHGRAFANENEAKILDIEDRANEDFWSNLIAGEKCDQVFARIMKLFNARMYQRNGAYKMKQIQDYNTAPVTQKVYDRTYAFINPTPLASELYQHNIEVTTEASGKQPHRMLPNVGKTTRLPKVRSVLIKHKIGGNNNLAHGLVFKNLSTPAGGAADVVEDLVENIILVDNTADATLRIDMLIEHAAFSIAPEPNILPVHNMVLHLTVKVGDYYLQRERCTLNDALEWDYLPLPIDPEAVEIEYSDMQWVDTPAVCEVILTKQVQAIVFGGNASFKTRTEIELETPPLIESGELSVRLQYYEAIRPTINVKKTGAIAPTVSEIIVTNATLPNSATKKEKIDRLVKVKGDDRAFEFNQSSPSGDEFSIDNANNKVILATPVSGPFGVPGRAEVHIEEHGQPIGLGGGGQDYSDTSKYRFSYETLKFSISVDSEDANRNVSDSDYRAYLAENNENNRATVEEEMRLGDVPNGDSIHRLRRVDGIEYVDTELWRQNGVGASETILQHKADVMAQFRERLIKVLTCSIRHYATADLIEPDTIVTYDGVDYIMMGGRYDCWQSIFTGVFVEISREDTPGTTIKDSGIVKSLGSGNIIIGANNTSVTNQGGEDSVVISVDGLITHTTAPTTQGVNNGITVQAVGDTGLVTGDTIILVNPVTGLRAEVVLTEDLVEGDNNIVISEVLVDIFPEGTLVLAPEPVRDGGLREILIKDVTGLYLDLTDKAIPNEGDYEDYELNELVQLERNGTRQLYDSALTDYRTYKLDSANERIVLNEPAVIDEYFVIKI